MISKILVPHDGSEMSDKAFEKAVELAKMFKAPLYSNWITILLITGLDHRT